MTPNCRRKFSQEEKTPNFFETSNIKWHGKAVPAMPFGTALLLIDETNDISNTEQESIYAKYVNDNGLDSVLEVCCYFLGFIQVGE